MSVNWTIEDYPFLPTIGQGGTAGTMTGTLSVTLGSDGSATQAVTFATPFTTVPVVVSNPNTVAELTTNTTINFYNITTAGFDVYVGGQPNTTVVVGWIASNG